MTRTQKAKIEKLIDEISEIGEGKLVIVWDGEGRIRCYKQIPYNIVDDELSTGEGLQNF